MSTSEQGVDCPIADNRSETGVVLPVEAIGPIDHPSYSDNEFPATIQNRLFPVHSLSSNDLLLSQPLLPHAVPAQFKSWPRVSSQWIDWVNRLQPRFGDQWKSQGLWSLIELSKGQLDSSITAFFEFLQSGTFDELTPPPRPRVGSFDQSWVVAYPSFRDDSPEFVFDTLLTACIHHRFLIVDYLGARSPVVPRANISWSFELYNPALFSRQFGLSQVIPHLVLYYPMDILHLDSEIGSGLLSKATVELLAAAPSSFLSPIRVYTPEDVSSFSAWWPPRRAVLAPTFDYPSGLLLFLHICLFFLLHCAWLSMFLAFAAKGKKSIAPASVDKSTIAPPIDAKSKKRKVSSAPPHSIQSSKVKKYSTRNSGRLKSRFSNTEADPVDLVSSSHITDDEEDNSEREDIGLAPESALPSIPLDFSSRRAQLQELDSSSPDVDLSFADVEASTSSQLAKSFPSAESLSYARTAVHNFLELGLHQLGESQRLDMISAVSILKASPEFSAEHPLLDSIATIFSDSDVAQTKLTSLMAKRDDFHNKPRRAEAMEQENLSV
ncbi:hypothetical protein F511_06610 [Dorcoceras hygrometricum]|uniref:Uncharacterized protein n=1 Tax=Dorcoceras hygrometricum TaxID=472368 RepID=A0A2Z7B5N9_9LAMI|nr:hypothetical protein F511_06610 [Dorcoceras hygrometricum]